MLTNSGHLRISIHMKKIDEKFDLEHYLRHKYILLKATFCPKWEASVNIGLGEG